MTIDTVWFEENILLHKLNEQDCILLNEVFETGIHHTGDEIISEGNLGGDLYILRAGSTAITQKSNQKCCHLGHASEGALFGSMSFLSDNLSSATVTAHSKCLTYKLNYDGYIKLLTQNHELLFSLFTYMLNQSGEILRKMNSHYAEKN